MKTLNKKGTTLAELVVSITLLSVVLVFMFRLLVDLNNEQTNDNFANDNQVVRAEIIKYIEEDLTENVLTEISNTSTNKDKLKINFHYEDGVESILEADSKTVTYKNKAGNSRKWSLKNCRLYTNKANVNFAKDGNIVTLNINIEIHTNNDYNTVSSTNTSNNTLDDISISYIGPANSFNSISGNTCLGYCCNNTCN